MRGAYSGFAKTAIPKLKKNNEIAGQARNDGGCAQ